MSQNRPNNSGQPQSVKPDLDPDLIKAWISNQSKQLEIEAKRISLEEKQLDHNAKISEKSLEFQSQILSRRPAESRKTITRLGYIIGGIIALFMIFIGFLVYSGHENFADQFMKIASYVVTSLGSFWIGRKSIARKESSTNSDVEDAELVDEP